MGCRYWRCLNFWFHQNVQDFHLKRGSWTSKAKRQGVCTKVFGNFWSQVIDLNVPAEEVEFERALAKRSGIDGLIFDLLYHKRSLKAAAQHLSEAMLSDLERKVLGEMSEEELVEVSWFSNGSG